MSIGILILGESGTGKTTSLRNLDPAQTLLIQSVRKPLPFRSKDWRYLPEPGGSIYVSDQSAQIINAMRKTKKKVIVIDDYQYILTNEFMRRSEEKGFDKFSDIGRHAWDIVVAASTLPDDVRVYILGHTQTDEFGKTKIKTIGKLLDEKVVIEGMFSIVLRTCVQNGNYLFSTRNNGSDTVKTPIGLFDDEYIGNDLAEIDAAIFHYYGMQERNAA